MKIFHLRMNERRWIRRIKCLISEHNHYNLQRTSHCGSVFYCIFISTVCPGYESMVSC